jgi:hypothetical protein
LHLFMDRRSYDDAALRAAVAQSRSWRGVLRHLGLAATSAASVRSVKRHVERLELDTSHFTGQRRWTEQQLAQAVADARTWAQVQNELGLSGGSSTSLLKGHAARLGIDTRHLDRRPSAPLPGLVPMRPAFAHLPKAGASMAAGWLILCGYEVAWPLEPCRYDLVAAHGGAFMRVQVKTSRVPKGDSWIVSLSTDGGRLTYDPDDIDCFFVIDGDLEFYLIPVAVVGGLHAVTLSGYQSFRVDRDPLPST